MGEVKWLDDVTYLRAALGEISRGRGAYSHDHLEHAGNCIDAMKAVALGALNGTWDEEADDD